MTKKYNKYDVISMISEKTDYHEENIKEILVALEEIVNDLLLTADEENDIEIKFIPGLILSSSFIPKHDKRLPNGTIRHVNNSVRFRAKFTDNFIRSRRKSFEFTQNLWERVKRRNRK